MISRKKQLQKSGMLILTAFIWGVAFVAQSEAIKVVDAFTINCVRFLIGAVTLLPVIYVMDRINREDNAKTGTVTLDVLQGINRNKTPWLGGAVCGLVLCAATNLQQIGLKYTTAGKAGFITAFYIVLVPVAGIFLKKRASFLVWISVAVAVIGLGLLCINKDDLSIGMGELLVFACAMLFTVHILCVDYFVKDSDGVKLSCIQFAVSGLVSGVFMFIFENPQIHSILSAWMPILYTGVLSSGVAYTLQVVGQKDFNPTIASLLMSFESVFSVLAGWVILKEKLTLAEGIGCVLMFVAIILAQLPADMFKRRR